MATFRAARLAFLMLIAWVGAAESLDGARLPARSTEAAPVKSSPATAGSAVPAARALEPVPKSPASTPGVPAEVKATAPAGDAVAPPAPLSAAISPSKSKTAAIPSPVKVSSDPRPALDPGTFINTLRAAERVLALAEAGGWPALPASARARTRSAARSVLMKVPGSSAGRRIAA